MQDRNSAPKSRCHSATLRLLIVGLALVGLFASLPGCGGCNGTQNPQAAAKKKKEDEEAAKKKKKKKDSEKPKQNFDPILMRQLPSNDPTVNKRTPDMHIKAGHWVAIDEVTKANNFDFVGELTTFVEAKGTNPPLPLEIENTNSRLSVWRPASLPKGQTKHFETLLFVPKRPEQAGNNYALRSELRALRGGGLQEPAGMVTSALKDYEHLIVVLASNPAAYTTLDKLNSVRMPEVEALESEPLSYYYVLRPNAEKRVPLPSHALALTTMSHIVWDDINPAVLTAEQAQAMLDWLHWGGQIIISGPGSLDKLKGSFLHAYLPAETAETVKLDQSAFDELNAVWSLAEKNKPNRVRTITIHPERPMVGVRFKKHVDAVEVAGTGGLVLERRLGGGRIVVTAFPLTDVRVKQWKNIDNFFNNVLLRRPPRRFRNEPQYGTLDVAWAPTGMEHMKIEPRLGSTLRYFSRDVGPLGDYPVPIASPAVSTSGGMPVTPGMPITTATTMAMQFGGFQEETPRIDTTGTHPATADWHFGGYVAAPQMGVAAWRDEGAATDAARQALAEAANIEIPDAAFVFRVLAVYLLILVPINWLVFWLLGRVEWAWIAAPIIAVVGAVAVIRLAQLDIGFARSRSEIAVLEIQGGYERAHLTRYTALYTSLSSNYRLNFPEQSALALPLAEPRAGQAQQIASIDNVMFRRDKDWSLSGVQVQSNLTKSIHSEQIYPLEGKLTLIGDEKKGWTVKNTSGIAIKDVGLFRRSTDGQLQHGYIAKLEPQTAAPITFRAVPMVVPPPAATEQSAAGARLGETEPQPKPVLWLPEWNQTAVMKLEENHSDEKGLVRLTKLARLAVERLDLFPGDVRLVGWTDEVLGGMEISPEAPQNRAYTLVLAHLARGSLPKAIPDVNVAEDYYEPPLDPEIQAEIEKAEAAEAGTSDGAATSGS
jgi:hypothetical protein